jgi:hypothetical protein
MFAGSWNAFDEQIDARMADKELRCEVIKAFARIDRRKARGSAEPSENQVCKFPGKQP